MRSTDASAAGDHLLEDGNGIIVPEQSLLGGRGGILGHGEDGALDGLDHALVGCVAGLRQGADESRSINDV